MLIYLIRHGETEFNKEQRYQGSMDISLSKEGRERIIPAEFSPAVVYTSHLRRTKETAEILFPGAEQIAVSDLREMSFGDYEGRSKAELAGDPDYAVWLASGFTGECPNSEESHDTFVRRTCEAFSRLTDEALSRGEAQLVIVAHGGTQMAVMSAFAEEERPFGGWLIGNAGGYILDTERWQRERKLTVVRQISYLK